VTEPVTSLAAASAAATGTAAAVGVARSLSTVSLSLASLAAGSACAFSTLSRRSLVLVYWLAASLEVFDAGLQRQDIGVDPRDGGSSARLSVPATSSPKRCERPAVAIARRARRHHRQRQHGRNREPALAEHALVRLGCHLRRSAIVVPVASPADMIRTCRGSAAALLSERQPGEFPPRELHLGSVNPGCFGLAVSDSEVSAIAASCPGTRSGADTIGWTDVSDKGEPAGVGPREPESPLICSALCSLTVKSPVKD